MNGVDVTTETVINQPVHMVAQFAGNPDNAPGWYLNISKVEWKSVPAVVLGAQVAFVAHFLGRRLAYTYEIVELVHDQWMVMRTADGPFPMETTYSWARTLDGRTRMTLRNRGYPIGFARWFAPFMTFAMRRANVKDLSRLKALLESGKNSPRQGGFHRV